MHQTFADSMKNQNNEWHSVLNWKMVDKIWFHSQGVQYLQTQLVKLIGYFSHCPCVHVHARIGNQTCTIFLISLLSLL